MNKAYNPIDWKNEPNTSTPINETNLNKMDRAIDTIDNRVIDLDKGKVNKEEGKSLVSNTDISKIGANETAIQAHISDKSNPHSVTKAQVGLGNVDNTSDADKPISTEQQAEFDAINSNLDGLEYGEVAGGKNLFKEYVNMDGYSISNEKYNGYPVIYKKGPWNGARANTILKAGKTYVVTLYAKGTGQIALYDSTSFTAPAKTITSDWIRYGWVIYDVTSDTNELRVENVSDSGETYIACMQIEEGTTATDYEPYIPSVKMLAEEVNQQKNDLFDVKANMSHNIPRTIPKDITSYYNDGTIWKRLNGTDGFSKYEDIFVGDYFKMSRAISAYNQDQNYQLTGSDWVTIAGISTLLGNGDTGISYEHLVMVPGKGFGGTQHFGRSRMNPTNTTVGGYVGSEMHTTTIGEVVSSGSTATTATINQQLYAEFGSHLKTTRELLSKSLNSTGYNRFGEAGGCSNNWGWYDCQAVLMSEIEVYGSIVWSSSGYDTGNAKMQLPLFANNRQAMNNRSSWYWLKDVASASYFCLCNGDGDAVYDGAGDANGCVRPRFVIAA